MRMIFQLGLSGALACSFALPSFGAEQPSLQVVVGQLKPDLYDRLKVVVEVTNLGHTDARGLKVTCRVSKNNRLLGKAQSALKDLAPGEKAGTEVLVPVGKLQKDLSASCRVVR